MAVHMDGSIDMCMRMCTDTAADAYLNGAGMLTQISIFETSASIHTGKCMHVSTHRHRGSGGRFVGKPRLQVTHASWAVGRYP